MAVFAFDESLLVELTEAHGVPGYEGAIRDVVRREFEGAVDRVRTDAMGNVVGTIEGSTTPEYEVVVAGHMDEIGFMVRNVDEDGFVQVDALGGWDPQVLRSQRVVVHTDDGDVPGVIGSVPPHTGGSDDGEEREVADVDVDLGLGEDAVRERVTVGDRVSMRQTTEVVGDCVTGKALDNRVSVFALCVLADRLDDPDVTVHFAATVQEEVGLRGAEAIGTDVAPDLALCLDTTVANDVPETDEDKYVTNLGDGVGVKYKDSSVIANRKVLSRLRELAADRAIAHQHEVLPAGGTDTGGLQRTGGAAPVGALSFPTRYLHTTTEAVHGDDVAAALDLAAAFLATETGEHDYSL